MSATSEGIRRVEALAEQVGPLRERNRFSYPSNNPTEETREPTECNTRARNQLLAQVATQASEVIPPFRALERPLYSTIEDVE